MKSETDTEIIVQLIELFVKEGLEVEEAFRKTLTLLKARMRLALIRCSKMKIRSMWRKIRARFLLVLANDFNVVASDAMAMLQVTDQYVELMDKEIVIVTKDNVTIQNLEGETINTRSLYSRT